MKECLKFLNNAPGIDVRIILTGQATIARYADLDPEIASEGLEIIHRIPVRLGGNDGREMAVAMATELAGLADYWAANRPDMVLLLGDRGEMLAAAIAAFHLEIPIGHLHGGERSGTIDEGFRHAISKLATYHFVASEDSRKRLLKMGEISERVMVVGAPGLVGLSIDSQVDRNWLSDRFSLPSSTKAALMLFHPVVQERHDAFRQTRAIMEALSLSEVSTIILRPNSDAGGQEIDRCIDMYPNSDFQVLRHLPRADFLRTLQAADFIIGNSSAGIIESASLDTPCINMGSRQSDRLRNDNVIDCAVFEVPAICRAIDAAVSMAGPFHNRYGDGLTNARLVECFSNLAPGKTAPVKRNSY